MKTLFSIALAFTNISQWSLPVGTVNAAGIKKKDINVNVSDDRLTVKSEDKLNKVISLPKNADVDNITGSHIDGMLKLTIPLTNKTRKIKIK